LTMRYGRENIYAHLKDMHSGEDFLDDVASRAMREWVAGVREELVIQTPYLLFSRLAKKMFKALQKREQPPVVWVSTNSLAATDALPVYAMSHKYKRFYLRELGFRIHEFKPYPEDAPIQVAATGAL